MPLRLSRCEALDGHGLSPVTKEPFLFHIPTAASLRAAASRATCAAPPVGAAQRRSPRGRTSPPGESGVADEGHTPSQPISAEARFPSDPRVRGRGKRRRTRQRRRHSILRPRPPPWPTPSPTSPASSAPTWTLPPRCVCVRSAAALRVTHWRAHRIALFGTDTVLW